MSWAAQSFPSSHNYPDPNPVGWDPACGGRRAPQQARRRCGVFGAPSDGAPPIASSQWHARGREWATAFMSHYDLGRPTSRREQHAP